VKIVLPNCNFLIYPMDPIEEAEAFRKYVLDYGWGGVSQLAHVISKSEQFVSSRIQLLRLPKEIIDSIL
jgi:ParB family chromosome partitioning protein